MAEDIRLAVFDPTQYPEDKAAQDNLDATGHVIVRERKSHDCWGTPIELFKTLDNEFHFDLDAAATKEDTLCERFISPEEDALKTPWVGNAVFCNPPYGTGGPKGLMGQFIARGYEQHLVQKNTVVMLIPAYTDPRYWAEYVMKAHEVRFLSGRLKFRDNKGTATMSARFPSVVVVFKYLHGICFGKAPNQFIWSWK